jgi:hypothetical protein
VLRKALSLLLAVGLLGVAPLAAQTAGTAADPEVLKGIRLVDEGDYDAAIVTLDAAARRLATDKTKVKDLSQAYLYLGIAYVGKGHEAAAKAKFREAVSQIKDLSLSADRYPPKVINLFEAAKDEARRGTAPPPSSARATPPPAAGQGGGGSKKILLIGGGLAVAGGGAYLAFGKKSDDGSCDSFFVDRSGLLNANQTSIGVTTTPTEDGHWSATLTYNVTASGPSSAASASGSSRLPPQVNLFAVVNQNDQSVGPTIQLTTTSKEVQWEGTAGTIYRVGIELADGAQSATYQLVISGPCF